MKRPNMEGTNTLEQLNAGTVRELPQSHLEEMDISNLEKLSRPEYTKEVGRHFFSDSVENSPGILGAFREMEKKGGKEQFARHYSNYITQPGALNRENPDMYGFLRDRIFHGREYGVKLPSSQQISFL